MECSICKDAIIMDNPRICYYCKKVLCHKSTCGHVVGRNPFNIHDDDNDIKRDYKSTLVICKHCDHIIMTKYKEALINLTFQLHAIEDIADEMQEQFIKEVRS